jgi:glycosyltransferase involved in cell wall biosynthesis
MKISIVTLSFNQRAFLQEAIESVLQQGYPDLEYIVIDPGSTDGSRELIQSYASSITRIIFEPDKGAADGLGKGFAIATGDIFGFLNSDDLLEPGSLQRIVDFFQSHPEYGILMGNGYIVDADGKPIRHVRSRTFTVERYLYGGTQFLQQSTFFRREAYLKSPGFNPANRSCWDGELFVNMAHRGAKVAHIDADLGRFRIHSQSITGSKRLHQQYLEDLRRIFQDIRGRDWRATDNFQRWLYRGEAALRRLGLVRQSATESR